MENERAPASPGPAGAVDGWTVLRLMRRIGCAIEAATTFSAAAQIAVTETCVFFDWPVGRAWVEGAVEKDPLGSPNCWYFKDPLRFEPFYAATEMEFFGGKGCLPAEVRRVGAPVWVDDLSEAGFFARWAVARQVGLTGGLALPVLHEGRVRAILEFFFDDPAPDREPIEDILGHVVVLLARTAERLRLRGALRVASSKHDVLSLIMELSTQNLPLDELLGRSLGLVLAHQNFGMEPRGSIFLAKGETLMMVAQRGLAPETQERCRRVPFGSCICGRAARLQESVHVPCIDDRHEITHAGMRPHGHFCIPIQRGDRLLGVMNLYLPQGMDRKAVAEDFLAAAANALALAIADHEMDASLTEAKEEAEAADQAKTRFLQHMSHELRTPLNAIIGFSDMMSGEMLGPLGNDSYRGYATDIGNAGRHLLQVIGDILDIVDLESGALRFKEGTVDLNDLVRECCRIVSGRGTVPVATRLHPRLPCLRADGGRIVQVLHNLLENALAHTPPGGAVCVATGMDDRRGLYFQVSDTGPGMTPEQIGEALKPFGRLGDLFVRERDGAGLGLPLSHRFMRMHGGDLVLESSPGEGTVAIGVFPPDRTLDVCPTGRCALAAPVFDGFRGTVRFDGLSLNLPEALPRSDLKPSP